MTEDDTFGPDCWPPEDFGPTISVDEACAYLDAHAEPWSHATRDLIRDLDARLKEAQCCPMIQCPIEAKRDELLALVEELDRENAGLNIQVALWENSYKTEKAKNDAVSYTASSSTEAISK